MALLRSSSRSLTIQTLSAASLLLGCSGESKHATSAATGPVVAKVGDGAITADEFKARAAEQPIFQRQRLQTIAGRKELLENLTKFEILSQEAIREGIDKTPEMQAMFKRALVQELVKKFYEQKAEPTEDELKAYYDKHQGEFVKPEQRRVQQIFLAAPEGPTEEQKKARVEAKKKAESLLAQIQAADLKVATSTTPNASIDPFPLFGELAAKYSADPSKGQGGDSLLRSRDDFSRQYSAQFASAVFTLTPQKRLSGVIETPKGFHIARLLQVDSGAARSFDDVKSLLKDRVAQEQRTKRFDDFYEKLKKETSISVDEKELQAVELPAPKPSTVAVPSGVRGSPVTQAPPPAAPPTHPVVMPTQSGGVPKVTSIK